MDFKKLIIDVDTGVDDALAIMYLVKKIPEKILGITVCAGNTNIENAVCNTLRVLDTLNCDIPVYIGESVNSRGENFIHAKDYHGKNGLVNISNKTNRRPEKLNAGDFIVKSAIEYGKDLALLCLAPPTNISKAIRMDINSVGKIGTTVIMGGAVNVQGNQTKYAEFNFFQDPCAVSDVFKNLKNIYLITQDTTQRCFISEDEFCDTLSEFNKSANLVKHIIINWYELFGSKAGRKFELYDPLAASVFVNDFLEFEPMSLDIVTDGEKRGALISGTNQMKYARKVNSNLFKKDLLNSFF